MRVIAKLVEDTSAPRARVSAMMAREMLSPAPAAMAVLLLLVAAVVMARAGLVLPGWWDAARWLVWFIVAFSALGTVMNLITPSATERIWAPVTAVLLACSLVVALAPVP